MERYALRNRNVKSLPRITKQGILTREGWNSVARVIEANFREVMIQPGQGYEFNRSPGGTTLRLNPGGSPSAVKSPFTVVTQSKPGSTTGEKQWGVIHNSNVYLDIGPATAASWHAPAAPSTGGNGYPLGVNPSNDDGGWITINPSVVDVLYLEYIANYNRISICSNGTSGTFSTTASPWITGSWVENTGTPPAWNLTRKVIATATTSSGVTTVTQMMKAHQLMRPVSVAGKAAWWPIDVIG